MNDFNDRLVLYYSKKKLLLFVIGGFIMAFMSIMWTLQSIETGENIFVVIGGLCSLLFGAAFFLMTKRILAKGENAVIDKYGIYVVDWRCGRIPWSEITEVSKEIFVGRGYTTKVITFRMKNPEQYIHNMAPIAKFIMDFLKLTSRGDKFSLQVELYQISYSAIWDHILKLISVYEMPITVKERL